MLHREEVWCLHGKESQDRGEHRGEAKESAVLEGGEGIEGEGESLNPG